jgi:undecaprenyl diphosphate synthase
MSHHLPLHVAIIMDGNGRWAEKRHLSRSAGHKEGSKVVEKVIEHAIKRRIKYLTLFAFSLDNLKRPKREINALMSLLTSYLQQRSDLFYRKNVRLNVIGDRTQFTKKLQTEISEVEEKTKENTSMILTVALYYTGRFDILQAAQRLAKEVKMGHLSLTDVDEFTFKNMLLTAALPSPDLLIRTSGEERISNFMLWDCAYTEFYFTQVLWPDFNAQAFDQALEAFSKRKRRFGHINEKQKS